MEKLLLSLGLEKISSSYFFSDTIGSLMVTKNVLLYNPVSSFTTAELTLDYLQYVLENAKTANADCIILVNTEVCSPEDKDIYPDYLIHLNDSAKESEFKTFYEENKKFIEEDYKLSSQENDMIFFVDPDNNNQLSYGWSSVDESGNCNVTTLFQSDEPFLLKDFKEPAPFMSSLFPDLVHLDDSIDLVDFFTKNTKQQFFYCIKLKFERNAIQQQIEIHNRASAIRHFNVYLEDEDYDYDDENKKTFFRKQFTTKLLDGKFTFDSKRVATVVSEVDQAKMKHLFSL